MASYLSKESPVFIERKGIDLGILAVVDAVFSWARPTPFLLKQLGASPESRVIPAAVFLEVYRPTPHERHGEIRKRENVVEGYWVIRSNGQLLVVPPTETERPLRLTELVQVALYEHPETTIGLGTPVLLVDPVARKLLGETYGFLPKLDICRPMTDGLIASLKKELRERVGLSRAISVRSSERSGHVIGLDIMTEREYVQFSARAGLINHPEWGMEAIVVDARYLDHNFRNFATESPLKGCLRLFPGPLKLTQPEIIEIWNP